MKKNYIYFIALLISTVSFGQYVVIDVPGGGNLPDNWVGNNQVATNPIDQSDSYLVEAGSPSDDIETDIYELAGADNGVTIEMDIANFSTGAENRVKIEISYDGGSSYLETKYTPITTGAFIGSGAILLDNVSDNMKFKLSNDGTTGKGVRLQNIVLKAIVSFKAIQVFSPEWGEVLAEGTTSKNIDFSIYNSEVGDYAYLTYIIDGEPTVYDEGIVVSGHSFDTADGTSYKLTLTLYDVGDNYIDEEGVDFSVAGTLSIGKNEIEGFSVYPNPVNTGSFKISSSNGSDKNVQLYDTLGKQVLNKNIQRNENIDVSNLNAGIYILKVEEKGKVATRKLIIN